MFRPRSAAISLCLVLCTTGAQCRGFDWFFANVKPDVLGCLGRGIPTAVSYYGKSGRPTANGEEFPTSEHTAASRHLKFGTRVQLTNPRTGRSISIRINDRGPFGCGSKSCASREHQGLATLHYDLSPSAAAAIGKLTTQWVCASRQ